MVFVIIVCAIALAALVLVCTLTVKRHIDSAADDLLARLLARIEGIHAVTGGAGGKLDRLAIAVTELPQRRKVKAPKVKVTT